MCPQALACAPRDCLSWVVTAGWAGGQGGGAALWELGRRGGPGRAKRVTSPTCPHGSTTLLQPALVPLHTHVPCTPLDLVHLPPHISIWSPSQGRGRAELLCYLGHACSIGAKPAAQTEGGGLGAACSRSYASECCLAWLSLQPQRRACQCPLPPLHWGSVPARPMWIPKWPHLNPPGWHLCHAVSRKQGPAAAYPQGPPNLPSVSSPAALPGVLAGSRAPGAQQQQPQLSALGWVGEAAD